MSTTFHPKIQFEAIITIELMVISQAAVWNSASHLMKGSENRRDTWLSRQDAHESLKSRKVWRVWDDRALKLFIVRFFFTLHV
jgi:hypothetical protein